jgi:hypothetical protein
MKNILLTLICLLIGLQLDAQWKFVKSVDELTDQDNSHAYCRGYGGEFPYENPVFGVNNYRIYILDALHCVEDGTRVQIRIDKGQIFEYTSGKVNAWVSKDGKSFMVDKEPNLSDRTLNWDEQTQKLIDEIKEGSYMTIRIETDYGINQFKVPLKGSTKAINSLSR